MNVMAANDIDPTPDRIAARLAGEELRSWIVDEQFIEDRNAVIACIPEKTLGPRAALDRVMRHSHERLDDPPGKIAKPRSFLWIALMSKFPADRRETWITGIGLVSSLGTGWKRIGKLSTAAE